MSFIPNALDREFESVLAELPLSDARSGITFCASDLHSPGKIDSFIVRRLTARFSTAVRLIGRNSPFGDTSATNLGEIRVRRDLARAFAESRTLVFTSQMDNAPLTIIEALSVGTYVVAYPSSAAAEMLEMVGGRCAASPEEAAMLVEEGREAELYGGRSHTDLADAARRSWSGRTMAEAYRSLYEKMVQTA